MSKKDLVNHKGDEDDEEEDDDDYCPTNNAHEQSDASDLSEEDDDGTGNNADKQLENEKQNDLNVTPYDESKTNDLWKNFASSTQPSLPSLATIDKPKVTSEIPNPKAAITMTTKIFDYAGEKVSVPSPTNVSLKRPAPSSAASASVLDRLGLGKKAKLSTLEKSRLDWSEHKQSESLIDDLDSHRRGKDSYVEKKAFLQRSEVRQHDHFLTNVKKK